MGGACVRSRRRVEEQQSAAEAAEVRAAVSPRDRCGACRSPAFCGQAPSEHSPRSRAELPLDQVATTPERKRPVPLAPVVHGPSSEPARMLDHTPSAAEKDTFKFYCPLCMYHFTCAWRLPLNVAASAPLGGSAATSLLVRLFPGVLQTKCCSNYSCEACTLDYLKGAAIPRAGSGELTAN